MADYDWFDDETYNRERRKKLAKKAQLDKHLAAMADLSTEEKIDYVLNLIVDKDKR